MRTQPPRCCLGCSRCNLHPQLTLPSGLEDEVRSERRWRKEQAQTTRASMHALASRLPLVEKAIQARARATQGACRATMRQLAALRQVILEAVPPGSSPGMPRTRALSLLDAVRM